MQHYKQHQNQPGVVHDPVITMTRHALTMVRVEAQPYPGARPDEWLGVSETVAIAYAGQKTRAFSPNAVLCVEWPAQSVAHESKRHRPAYELESFWLSMRSTLDPASHARANAADRTMLDIDSVDSWAEPFPWIAPLPVIDLFEALRKSLESAR